MQIQKFKKLRKITGNGNFQSVERRYGADLGGGMLFFIIHIF